MNLILMYFTINGRRENLMAIFLIVEVLSAKTLKTIDVCTDWFRYL